MASSSLCDVLSQLSLAEKSAINLEKKEPDYVLHVDSQKCENCRDARFACTSSNNSVRLFTRHNLAAIGSISGHEKAVTGVKFSQKDWNILYTSSTDGTVKKWDMRDKHDKPSHIFEGFAETNNVFTAFDVNCNDKVICAGTEALSDNTHLIFWDQRSGEPMGVYEDSHQDDITQVKFHPIAPNRLASGSTDGLVCTFDIRQDSEDDAILSTLNSESSVSQMGWCGNDLENVYCLTHTETFHIWHCEESDVVTELNVGDVRDSFEGENKVEYLIDCFQSTGESNPVLVAGTHSGKLHFLSVEGSKLSHMLALDGGHTDDIRCLTWDQQTGTLITGGDDAMVCLWTANSDKGKAAHVQKSNPKIKAKLKKKKSVTPY